ncbi:MAG: hypothetical protein J6N18_04080, partial [Kiritimatiellae bacterium]|nr:hypothetical protein [Kiritimatiellia bacterium]
APAAGFPAGKHYPLRSFQRHIRRAVEPGERQDGGKETRRIATPMGGTPYWENGHPARSGTATGGTPVVPATKRPMTVFPSVTERNQISVATITATATRSISAHALRGGTLKSSGLK